MSPKSCKAGSASAGGQQGGGWARRSGRSPAARDKGGDDGPAEGGGDGGGGGGLTFVARCPGLVAVVAGDAQDPLLDGREPHGPAGEVLH